MSLLAELLSGLSGYEQYGNLNEWLSLSEEEKKRRRVKELQEYDPVGLRSATDEYVAETALGMSPFDISAARHGLVRQPEPQGERVQVAQDLQEAAPSLLEKAQAAEEQEKADLQRQTNLSSLESMVPQDRLMHMRAQAKAKGRAGSLGAGVDPTVQDYLDVAGGDRWTEGTVMQQPDSPELQARLAERDEFIAGQPERDLMFAVTPDQARRNPQLALGAAEALTQLRQQKVLEGRQRVQEEFVRSLAGEGGTVPREKAAQLQALGVNVPYGAIGSSVDEGVAFFDDAIAKAGTFLSNLDPVDATSGHPMIKVQKYGAMLAEKYKQLVAEGLMNPDDARRQWQSEMAQVALTAGVINTQENASMLQE
jgi:hypothetical protein